MIRPEEGAYVYRTLDLIPTAAFASLFLWFRHDSYPIWMLAADVAVWNRRVSYTPTIAYYRRECPVQVVLIQSISRPE